MTKKIPCYVAQDLLPLYVEDLLSPKSAEDIRQHLEECEECRELYNQMKSDEPTFADDIPEVDHLKKINSKRRRLIVATALIVALVFCGAFISGKIRSAKADISFDEASKTMVIYGKDDTNIKLPETVNGANNLDAQFNTFRVEVFIPILRTGGKSLQEFLPDYLGRTKESLGFIRNYVKENCHNEELAKRANKYVDFGIMARGGYAWTEKDNRIKIEIGAYYWHREEMYVLSLLGSKNVRWPQLGYAWYLGSCIDPYSESLQVTFNDNLKNARYFDAYERSGGTLEPTPENWRKLSDAISYYCLTVNRENGTPYEVMPIRYTALYSAPTKAPKDPGDEMSVSMATSFIAYLADQYGFSAVSDFCFGGKTFKKTFGIDYQSAYDSWTKWIIETYGD